MNGNVARTLPRRLAATDPGFKVTSARVGLTGRGVNVRYTRVPRVPDWQLRKLMRFEVEEIGGFSAHADASELHSWLASAAERPKRVFLNHGDPHATDALRLRLKDDGYDVVVATEGVVWDLERDLREVVAPQVESTRDSTQVVGLFGGAALVFEDNTEEAALGVRAALRHMETGRLMRIPVVVRGTLCQRVRKLLTDEELEHVQLEP